MATKKKTSTKTRGKNKPGRKPNPTSKSGQVRALLSSGMSAADIAKKVGCTVGLVYNIKSKSGGGAKRGPGRPRKTTSTAAATAASDLDGILAAVKNGERERVRMRAALERIQAMIADVLA